MPNKQLGQHWLKDPAILGRIADSAHLSPDDTVLEIGPGLGTLTSALLRRAGRVIAVEYDAELARKLPGQFPGKNLEVVNGDILAFDVSRLPEGYKVVANVPYYITQKIVEKFVTADTKPTSLVMLVQKEVAQKLAATPGKLTTVAVKLQTYYDVQLGTRVQKEYFIPPPTIDSQVVICNLRHVENNAQHYQKRLFKVVEAGFSSPRKKIKASLSGSLGVSKEIAEALCRYAKVDPECRPSSVRVEQWPLLLEAYDNL